MTDIGMEWNNRDAGTLDADTLLTCGHHESLLIRSTESDYVFCEMCEARRQARDAETMEADLLKQRDRMRKAIQEALKLARPVLEKDEYMRRRAEQWAELAKLAREGHDVSRERERLDRVPPMVFDLSDLPRAIRLLQKALGSTEDQPSRDRATGDE